MSHFFEALSLQEFEKALDEVTRDEVVVVGAFHPDFTIKVKYHQRTETFSVYLNDELHLNTVSDLEAVARYNRLLLDQR